ncbi:snare-like protein [Xylaria scruposa]|nr:snare-like protein [Xylaria scruposa]
MKLYYIGILDNRQKPATQLCAEYDLSEYSRFTRREYACFMTAISKIVAERTAPGQRRSIEENSYTIHCLARSEGVAAVVISRDYPSLVAHAILSKVVDEFLLIQGNTTPINQAPVKGENSNIEIAFPGLREYLCAFQDPAQVNNISAIQRDLDETKILLQGTINAVLERGEKIDDLITKSSDLSMQSKAFYHGARQQNSCCIMM